MATCWCLRGDAAEKKRDRGCCNPLQAINPGCGSLVFSVSLFAFLIRQRGISRELCQAENAFTSLHASSVVIVKIPVI